MIGPGFKWTYFGRLVVAGTEAIPQIITCIDSANFTSLLFTNTPDGLFDYDHVTGVFAFKRRGLVDIAATLNIDSSTGIGGIEIITEYDSGAGFVKRNGRVAELPVIGQRQTVLVGTLEQVDKGHRLRFFVRASGAGASFKTQVLGDGSVVPAAILHMKMLTR